MGDGSENDESTKLNSVPEEDEDRSDYNLYRVLAHMEEEEEEDEEDDGDDDDEEEYEEDEDEKEEDEEVEDEEQGEQEEEEEKLNDGEKAMVVANNEKPDTDKVEDEMKAENPRKEDVDKGKDEKKVEEPKTGKELGESSQKKRSRPRNRNKKKVAQKESLMLAANGDQPESSNKKNDAQKSSITLPANLDKPESSNKKKGSKRVESMGMVFMCTSKTKTDCFRYKILGLPGNKKDQVAKIYKGMRLFLFDVDLRLMYGIFKAAGAGGFNLEPKAFNTDFPSQVRFTVLEDCLPLAEEKFKGVLKENYYSRNKFEGLLKAEQVRKLCKLFVEMGRGARSRPKAAIKSRRTQPVEKHRIRGDVSHRSRADDGPHPSRRREKRKRPLRPREEERPHPLSPPHREKRRYTDYEHERERERPVLYERERERERPVLYERERPVLYERERERERPVLYERDLEPVPRYLPALPPPSVVSPARLYSYERRPLDVPPYVRDRIPDHQTYRVVDERERDPYYSREAPSYREPVYTLPPEYHVVSREYHPPALQTQPDYRLSSGSRLPSYRDELKPPDYRSTAPTLSAYRLQTHFRY